MRPRSLSLDAFLARRASDRRLARFTHDLGLPEGCGLEFGPADNPTPLPEGLRVTYVDHCRDTSAGLSGATPIHHAWAGSGSLTAVLGRDGYDFAIAAQVGQYVPNLLGWLRGIHAALRPGGVLNLSLPDKRFMFDAARPVSTLAELIEADLLAYERPSPRQLFDHTYDIRTITPERIWTGEDPVHAPRMAGEAALPHAYAEAVDALVTDTYIACHCWILTPIAFLDLVECATRLNLFPFVLNQISATQPRGVLILRFDATGGQGRGRGCTRLADWGNQSSAELVTDATPNRKVDGWVMTNARWAPPSSRQTRRACPSAKLQLHE